MIPPNIPNIIPKEKKERVRKTMPIAFPYILPIANPKEKPRSFLKKKQNNIPKIIPKAIPKTITPITPIEKAIIISPV